MSPVNELFLRQRRESRGPEIDAVHCVDNGPTEPPAQTSAGVGRHEKRRKNLWPGYAGSVSADSLRTEIGSRRGFA